MTAPFRPVEGSSHLREIDLQALVQIYPGLADAPVSTLLLAEMLARTSTTPDRDIAVLLAGEGDLPFRPARVLMQDYAGLPALLDIAALRGQIAAEGRDPTEIGLSRPVHLVVDHSVMAMKTGPGAEAFNLDHEYANNSERFEFLKWAEQAFANLTVVPPGLGIVHQMNLEHFSEPVREADGWLLPDSLVGTDSHSTMCGGLGVLGWGVGGIEATAVLLDLPVAIPASKVVGVRLLGKPAPGVQATDIALQLTRFLRDLGVVGQIVEFFGPGLASLSVADRASIANMAPEYGATAGFFPADLRTAEYLETQGRAEPAARLRGWLARQPILTTSRQIRFSREVSFDLGAVGQTIAGPKLPHQLTTTRAVADSFGPGSVTAGLQDGDIVLAAITSCTITSNPRAMIAAGLLARNARARGLAPHPRIKASFSPGSRQVSQYLIDLGLLAELDGLGFSIAGYGCMTCVGNGGDLDPQLEEAIRAGSIAAVAVLSGNRNFEARIHPLIAQNYLMSPARVVAQALLGHMRQDLETADLGGGVRLADIWPDEAEIEAHLARIAVRDRDPRPPAVLARWSALPPGTGPIFPWPEGSSFFRPPEPGFAPPAGAVLTDAAPLLHLGDAITTDHISPVGRIAPDSPAGRHLAAMGVAPDRFGTYGARRGNPVVMRMGTFANPRLQNALATREGWFSRHRDADADDAIEAVAARYLHEGRPTVIIAGENYGIGSARDWAAKGTAALGVRAVIARSFERIHRTNLALLGVLPLQIDTLPAIDLRTTLVSISETVDKVLSGAILPLQFKKVDGVEIEIRARCRLDTAFEVECWRAGGMLQMARLGRTAWAV
jgi:aconitate hydratase